MLQILGRLLANYLNQSSSRYVTRATTSFEALAKALVPGDVLLVEGNLRVSTAIKYLTQSTWSHAALYVGDYLGERNSTGEALTLVEADLCCGVIAVPLSKYADFHTRICRPVGLSDADRTRIIQYAASKLGNSYDLKNVTDLMRYLLPTPPVPTPWRRRLLAFGSGEPTKAICSTLIAQAFQSVRYPILPDVKKMVPTADAPAANFAKEILHIRHHSLFTPRDFDISPYFQIIKPTVENGFRYSEIQWDE